MFLGSTPLRQQRQVAVPEMCAVASWRSTCRSIFCTSCVGHEGDGFCSDDISLRMRGDPAEC
jgi:hypothetical protein